MNPGKNQKHRLQINCRKQKCTNSTHSKKHFQYITHAEKAIQRRKKKSLQMVPALNHYQDIPTRTLQLLQQPQRWLSFIKSFVRQKCKEKQERQMQSWGSIQTSQIGQLFTPRVQQNCGTQLPLHILKDNNIKTAFYSLPQISFLEYEISQNQKIPDVKNFHYHMNQIHFINTRNRK